MQQSHRLCIDDINISAAQNTYFPQLKTVLMFHRLSNIAAASEDNLRKPMQNPVSAGSRRRVAS